MNSLPQIVQPTRNEHNELLLLDLPDGQVDLQSEYCFFSSAGENDQARLEYLAETVLPAWGKRILSLHEFAVHAQKFGLELWSAPSVKLTKCSDKEPFAFWIRFIEHLKGEVLVQCELLNREQVH